MSGSKHAPKRDIVYVDSMSSIGGGMKKSPGIHLPIIGFWFSIILLSLFSLPNEGNTYTVITVSTGAPKGLESLFLANTTNYLRASIVVNPLVPNTYQVTLYSLNPLYVPPIPQKVVSLDTSTWATNIQAMQSLLPAISSDSYTNGWANGMLQERFRDLGYLNSFFNLCDSTSTFLANGSTMTYVTVSSETCRSTLNTVSQFIFQQTYSTPVILNGY